MSRFLFALMLAVGCTALVVAQPPPPPPPPPGMTEAEQLNHDSLMNVVAIILNDKGAPLATPPLIDLEAEWTARTKAGFTPKDVKTYWAVMTPRKANLFAGKQEAWSFSQTPTGVPILFCQQIASASAEAKFLANNKDAAVIAQVTDIEGPFQEPVDVNGFPQRMYITVKVTAMCRLDEFLLALFLFGLT